MAMPAKLILESQEHAYFTNFVSRDVKFTETKASFVATFQIQRAEGPTHAFLTLYRGEKAPLGVLECERLRTAAALSPAVLRCHYSFRRKDEFYLFTEYCPRGSLKGKINRRNAVKMWHESDLLGLCSSLATCVVQLHAGRFSHGRLKAKNVFFTREKEVRIGGFSCENTQEYEEQNDWNDASEFRRDIQSLCLVFFEIAACQLISKSANIEALQTLIRSRYSHRTSEFLLAVNESPPESCSELLEEIEAIGSGRVSLLPVTATQCDRCKKYFPNCSKLLCAHSLCDGCARERLERWASEAARPGDISCPLCSVKLSLTVIEPLLPLLSPSARTYFAAWADTQVTGQCPFCAHEFPVLKQRKDSWRPYDVKCVCKRRFCSYCGLRGGHRVVMFHRRCYVFEARELQRER